MPDQKVDRSVHKCRGSPKVHCGAEEAKKGGLHSVESTPSHTHTLTLLIQEEHRGCNCHEAQLLTLRQLPAGRRAIT
eukprot:356736-Chlamydomonas_euryale.AAC.3